MTPLRQRVHLWLPGPAGSLRVGAGLAVLVETGIKSRGVRCEIDRLAFDGSSTSGEATGGFVRRPTYSAAITACDVAQPTGNGGGRPGYR